MLIVNKDILFVKENIIVKKGQLIPVMDNKDKRFFSVDSKRAKEVIKALDKDGNQFVSELNPDEVGFTIKEDKKAKEYKETITSLENTIEELNNKINEYESQSNDDSDTNIEDPEVNEFGNPEGTRSTDSN